METSSAEGVRAMDAAPRDPKLPRPVRRPFSGRLEPARAGVPPTERGSHRPESPDDSGMATGGEAGGEMPFWLDPTNQPTVENAERPARAGSQSLPKRRLTMSPANALASETIVPIAGADAAGPRGNIGFAKYELGSELGRGGMGTVRLATDRTLRRELAVKVLRQSKNATAVARFVEEAQITGQLEHPNIVPVHELGTAPDGSPYLALKCVRGQTLQEMVEEWRQRPVAKISSDDLARILDIFNRVCDAVAFAHDRGVIHRDLKPANVMVGRFGEVLVMDWGLAKSIGHTQRQTVPATIASIETDRGRIANPELTADGTVAGTPAFMPPEQAEGRTDAIDHRADIFALGGILYQLLTFEPPYTAASSVQALVMAAQWRLVPPRIRHPQRQIPRDLDAIVMKAMAKSPANRYPSVPDLQADLRAFQTFLPVSARRPSPIERVGKWMRRHPTRALVTVMLLMFASLFGTVVSTLQAQLADARTRESDARARELEEAAKRRAAEEDARNQAIATAIQQERYADLKGLLGREVIGRRETALREFVHQYWDAGEPAAYIRNLPPERLEYYIAAFEAVIDASNKAEEDWTNAKDYNFLGTLLLEGRGEVDRAMTCFARAIELDPMFLEPRLNRSVVLSRRGDYRGALADLDAVIAAQPGYFKAYARIANVHLNGGEWQAAVDAATKAIEIRPDYADAYLIRAIAHKNLGHWPAVIFDCTTFSQMAPKSVDGLLMQAEAHHQLGNRRDAIDSLSAALARQPENTDALSLRGQYRYETGAFAEALADLQAAVERDATRADTWAMIGYTYQAMQRPADAVNAYTQALAIDATDKRALLNRGNAYRALGHPDLARGDYERAIALDAGYAHAFYGRGAVKIDQGDLAGARDDFRRVMDLTDDPHLRAQCDAVLAQIRQHLPD